MKANDCSKGPFRLLKVTAIFFMTVIGWSIFPANIDTLGKALATISSFGVQSPVKKPIDLVMIRSELPSFISEPLCVSPEMAWTQRGHNRSEQMPALPDIHKQNQKIPYYRIIVQAAGRYRVDPYLIRAIIFAESGFNPRAKSKRGARGLMQLMPSTAKSLGIHDLFDPAQNIDGGVRYFKSLLDRFDGDIQLALAAYNAGARHVRNYDGIPPFRATKHYIRKVLKFQKKYKVETHLFSQQTV